MVGGRRPRAYRRARAGAPAGEPPSDHVRVVEYPRDLGGVVGTVACSGRVAPARKRTGQGVVRMGQALALDRREHGIDERELRRDEPSASDTSS